MARIIIPSALRNLTGQQGQLEVQGDNVGEALHDLTQRFPELRGQLMNEKGRLRNFVNVFVGDEDIRYLQQEATAVRAQDVISIVPAVAGGR